MEAVCSDSSSSVFVSPVSVVELPDAKKFETSVSVSNLAEKFEKSGDFSKSEEKHNMESEMKRSNLPEDKLEKKSVLSDMNGSASQPTAKVESEFISCDKEGNSSSQDSKSTNMSLTTTAAENGKEMEAQSFLVLSDASMSDEEAKNGRHSSVSPLSTSVSEVKELNAVSQNDSEILTESQTTNAIEERVAYFVNQMSETSQTSGSGIKNVPNKIPEDVAEVSVSQPKQNIEGISKQGSLKVLEKSFIKALDMVNGANEATKTADMLPVPSIEITEASDRENDSSDDAEETKPKRVLEAEIKSGKESEFEDKSEASIEERKAIFYISSSDLPAEPHQVSIENSNELPESSENVSELADSTRMQESNEMISSSCLRSKFLHGMTFLVAFVVATFGCILYGFAHQGKVPDFCEYLGLIIAILAGIVGAFSCFCYSCLEIFPGPSRAGYERIPETSYIPSLPPHNEMENADARSLDDSWSSEKERAFRIQNGMSSTRTSAASASPKNDLGEYLAIKKSERRELVDQTEQLKKGINELLDSFNTFISKLEPMDKLVKMESGMVNGHS